MTAQPKPVRLAFLGCGNATRMHSRTIARVARNVQLYYASRDMEKASEYCAQFRGAGAFGSYGEAIQDTEVQVVLVATPPSLHLELTLQALEAGKDVIVEKPAYLRVEDFATVREAIARSGRRVFVAENYFYKPLRTQLVKLLQEGIIGDPLFIHVNAVKRQAPEGWRSDPTQAGGGGLFEGGIHWINFMANLGTEVRSVTGFAAGLPLSGTGQRGNPSVEESFHIVLEYANGAVGSLSYSWEVPSLINGVHLSKIYGRKGSITFESNGIFVFSRGTRTRLSFPGIRDLAGYGAMFTDFMTALRTGGEPEMTLDMAELDVRLVQQIYNSSSLRRSDEPPQLEGT